MLVWVVIDRQHLRQPAPFASLHSSPLFLLPHLSPLLPVAYALPLATATPQPLCNQSVTHSFYLDGGYTPLRAAPTTAILSAAYPLLHISCIFNLLRTPLHFFAFPKNSTLLFSSDSALCVKKHNHRGGGGGQVASGKYGTSFRRYILTSLHPCFLFREETASARRADYRRWPRVLGTAAGAAPAPSLSIPSKC